MPLPWFGGPPNPQSGIIGFPAGGNTSAYRGSPFGSIWCTWSTHYETDGIDNDHDGLIDEGVDGIDNANNYLWTAVASNAAGATHTLFPVVGVDDPTEQEAPPPYRYPLRGIQVKIRPTRRHQAGEESTLVHEFSQE